MPRAAEEPLCFIDHDGRVFLVGGEGQRRLPRLSEVPFGIVEKRRLQIRGHIVAMASPADKEGHADWAWKDDLPWMADVDSIARSAANLSMARVVSKGVFTRPGEVLLVKATVGYYKGNWSLPGGYLDYGESPEQCLLREVEEELGVKGSVTRLLRVESRVVDSGLQFLSFLYEGQLGSDAFRFKADEIEDARWFPLAAAVREVGGSLGREGLEALLAEARSA